MAVPKRKHSNARTGTRRSHDHKKLVQLSNCLQCNKAIPTHTICPQCGYYMGRKVVDVADALEKKSKRNPK
ncbi:MAG: 50S ribosomal protein L32 [Planctomycetaceae bacterium]|nr:50S ribosomal protein L32 [Planctomycetaceae bacterium]